MLASSFSQLYTSWSCTDQASASYFSWDGIVCKKTNEYISSALTNNQLTGTIPFSIGLLVTFTYITLASNQFSGTIPARLGALSNLAVLDLSSNYFSGTILQVASLAKLREVHIGTYPFSCSIPLSLGQLKYLEMLNASSNVLRIRFLNGTVAVTK